MLMGPKVSTHAVKLMAIVCSACVCAGKLPAQPVSLDDFSATDRRAMTLATVTEQLAVSELGADATQAPALDAWEEGRALYASAQALVSEGEYGEAIVRLEDALQHARVSYYELYYLLALAKLGDDRLVEARVAAELAAALRPGEPGPHYLLGRVHDRFEHPEQALRHFRAATSAGADSADDPLVTAAWYRLGDLLTREGFDLAAAEALAAFDRAIYQDHSDHRGTREVASLLDALTEDTLERRLALLRSAGHTQEIVAATRTAHERRPQELSVARLYVRALLDDGQAMTAWELCAARLADAKVRREFVPLAREAASAAETLDQWIAQLARDVATDGAAAIARQLSDDLERIGDRKRAIPLWRALLRADPSDAATAWRLAGALRSTGDLRAALTLLIDNTRLAPPAISLPHEILSRWVRESQASDELPPLLREFGAQPEHDYATDFVLAVAAAAAGQDKPAEELFTACLAARPDFLPARIALPQIRLAQYRWAEARTLIEAVIDDAPDIAFAHFIRGEACAGLDQRECAEQAFKEALRLAPGNATFALRLAEFYRRGNDLTAAERYYQEAVTADPHNERALELAIDAYLAGGKREIARAQYENARAAELVSPEVLQRIEMAIRFVDDPLSDAHIAAMRLHHARHPTDRTIGLKLATALYYAREFDEAYKIAMRLFALAPDDEDVLLTVAQNCMRQLEFPRAIEALSVLHARHPERQPVTAALAAVCRDDFQVERCRTLLRGLLDSDLAEQERWRYRAELIESYVEFSEFDAALAQLDQWADEPEAAETICRERIRVLLLAERDDEAVALAREFQDEAPHEVDRRLLLLNVLIAGDELEIAEHLLRGWREKDMESLRWALSLVDVLLAQERAEEALDVLADLGPQTLRADITLRTTQARCEAALKRVDQAVARIEQVLEMEAVQDSPDERATVRAQLIELLVEAGEFDRALDFCAGWLESAGPDPIARVRVLELQQVVYLAADRVADYEEVMEMLLDYRPDDAAIGNDLGYSWVDSGRNLERATRMIRMAVAEFPMRAAYLDSLGWAYYKIGSFDDALKYLERAVRLREGQDPVLYDHLGDALFRSGDRNAARAHWQTCLELIEREKPGNMLVDRAELSAAVQGKLAALGRGESPAVAPLADQN